MLVSHRVPNAPGPFVIPFMLFTLLEQSNSNAGCAAQSPLANGGAPYAQCRRGAFKLTD